MIIRATEENLMKEIAGIERLLARNEKATEMSGKCARAYLRQLLRDRQAVLRTVRYRAAGEKPAPAKPVAAPRVQRPQLRLATHAARAW